MVLLAMTFSHLCCTLAPRGTAAGPPFVGILPSGVSCTLNPYKLGRTPYFHRSRSGY